MKQSICSPQTVGGSRWWLGAGRPETRRGDRKSPRYPRSGGAAEGTCRRTRGFRAMSNVVDLMAFRHARSARQEERAANYRHCVELARPQARRGAFESQVAPPEPAKIEIIEPDT